MTQTEKQLNIFEVEQNEERSDKLSNIKRIAKSAFNATSFDPDRRGSSFIKEVEENLQGYKYELGDSYNEKKIISLYESIISAQSRCMSWAITGPSNFPTRRNEKANNALANRQKDLDNYLERVRKAKIRQENKERIIEGGGELAIAKRKLENLTKRQEQMKAINKIIRRKPKNENTEEKTEELIKFGISENTIKELFTPDFCGRIGFASYQLTNNNATIKNTESRVRELERKENATNQEWTVEEEGQTVTVSVDYDLDRIIINHESKPSREIIQNLKKYGYNWSPRNQVWQRKITRISLIDLKMTNYKKPVNNGV